MEEKRFRPFIRLVAIAFLLALTLTTWQEGVWPKSAYAAPVSTTVFLDTATSSPILVTTAGSSGTISYTITNFNGTVVNSGGPLTVSDGHATVTVPQESDDYYTLHITDNTVSPATSHQINFTVVAPYTPDSSSPFGIGTHFRDGIDTNLDPVIKTIGTGFIRDDITWQDIERTPGVYDFSTTDPWIHELQQQGLTPLLILDYNNTNYDGGNFPIDTAGLTAFANFAKAAVTHYPQVQYVEIYNEYNGSPNCSDGPTCYTNLTKSAYQAIKSVRSDITVLAGSTGGLDSTWLTNLFNDGILSYIDGLSIHPYTGGQTAEPESGPIDQQITDTENLIKHNNNGQPKPIWVTELGWPTCCAHVDESTEAAYLVRGATMALAGGVQKFLFYDFLDGGTDPNYVEDHFGVLRLQDAAGNYTPKPAYTAYAVLARQLANETFVESQNQSSTGIYDEAFSKDNTTNLRVLWTSSDKPASLTLSASSSITTVSMTGVSQTVQPVNGQVTLSLTGNPIYVLGATVPVTGGFSSGFESSDPQPTWSDTVDDSGPPAGGIRNITGVCCGLTGPEAAVRNNEQAHNGTASLLYSGKATNDSQPNYAYMKVFNLNDQSLTVDDNTTLSYWVYPESSSTSYNYASDSNSTCVAIDLIFSDGTNLRDSGALDQNGNRAHPAYQCNKLTLDTWNHVTVKLGSYVSGKSIIRVDVGYDQPNTVGGYRGYLDDISITG